MALVPRVQTAPPGIGLSGTRCIIFERDKPVHSFHTFVSASALEAQLKAKERVRSWKAEQRQREEQEVLPYPLRAYQNRRLSSSSVPMPAAKPKAAASSSSQGARQACGLTQAEMRALMTRELTPEDYELLLRLDESVKKKNVMSEKDAAALLESTLEGADVQCSVCLCDVESGESTVLLACGHHFHPQCIRSWLVKKDTCPMCNAKASQDPTCGHAQARDAASTSRAAHESEKARYEC